MRPVGAQHHITGADVVHRLRYPRVIGERHDEALSAEELCGKETHVWLTPVASLVTGEPASEVVHLRQPTRKPCGVGLDEAERQCGEPLHHSAEDQVRQRKLCFDRVAAQVREWIY